MTDEEIRAVAESIVAALLVRPGDGQHGDRLDLVAGDLRNRVVTLYEYDRDELVALIAGCLHTAVSHG